jgi:hypothetical protein
MSLTSSPTSSISYLRGSSFFSALPFAIADGLRYAKGSEYVLGLSHWWKHVDDVSPIGCFEFVTNFKFL